MISPDTIALVRERTDIVALVRESVPSLKRRGKSWVGLCPFHNEKTGSFHVNPDRGFFHCFGCKESGSAIDFVMKHEGLSFPEAVHLLAERAGVTIAEEHVERTEVDRQKKHRDGLYSASQLAATYFEQQLREHPHRAFALGELARRGLVPSWAAADEPSAGEESPGAARQEAIDDAIQAFRIGYAPPGWDGLASFLRQQGVSPVAGEEAGLLVPRSSGSGHYDRFRHRLMFAVLDVQGRVVAFSGRALPPLPDEEPPKDKPAKYINSPESPIYTKGATLFGLYQARHSIRQAESATLVEGNFDVVSLHARGVVNTVAPLGTAFTADQAKLLKRFSSHVVLLFDADAAGKKAVRGARPVCREAGLSAKVASLPAGHDPDDFVRTKGAGALQSVVGQALGMLEFLLEAELDESFGAADIYEKRERLEGVKRLLAEEDDPLVRSMAKTYADRLAGRLDLIQSVGSFQALERSVMQGLAEAGPPPPPGPTPRDARVASKKAGSMERVEIVGALIEYPSLLVEPDLEEFLAMLEGTSAASVAALSRAVAASAGAAMAKEASSVPSATAQSTELPEKSLDTSAFLAQIPPSARAFAAERLAAPHHQTRDDALKSVLENGRKLRNVILERETVDLSRETYRAGGDWGAAVELAKAAEDRAREKHGMAPPTPRKDAAVGGKEGEDDDDE